MATISGDDVPDSDAYNSLCFSFIYDFIITLADFLNKYYVMIVARRVDFWFHGGAFESLSKAK